MATAVAFAGGLLGVGLGQAAVRRLTLLIFTAMGALLAVTVLDVLPDAKEALSWPAFLAAAVSGYALFWLVSRFLFHICPACSASALNAASQSDFGGRVLLLAVALAIHSTMDGVAVAVGDTLAGHADLAILFSVSFHKLPEGLALALLLLGAGYSRRTALLWTFAIEATTELGGLLGVTVLRQASPVWLAGLFAHVGGGFLYLVASDAGRFFGPPPAPARPVARPRQRPGLHRDRRPALDLPRARAMSRPTPRRLLSCGQRFSFWPRSFLSPSAPELSGSSVLPTISRGCRQFPRRSCPCPTALKITSRRAG